MGTFKPVPFQQIANLDAEAQRQIRRDFESITDQEISSGSGGHFIFVATANAQQWEIDRSDFQLTGSADEVMLKQIMDDHPESEIVFSSGVVEFASTLLVEAAITFRGCVFGTSTNNTTWHFGGTSTDYNAGFAGAGSTIPIIFGVNIDSSNVTFVDLKFTHSFSVDVCLFEDISTNFFNCRFQYLTVVKFEYMFGGAVNRSIAGSIFEHIYGDVSPITTFCTPAFGGIIESVLYNIVGMTVSQSHTGTSLFLYARPTSNTPLGTNKVLPRPIIVDFGTATLVAGTKVVSSAEVTTGRAIMIQLDTPGGTPGFIYVSARTAATSFAVTSTNGGDTSTFLWWIFDDPF